MRMIDDIETLAREHLRGHTAVVWQDELYHCFTVFTLDHFLYVYCRYENIFREIGPATIQPCELPQERNNGGPRQVPQGPRGLCAS